MNNIIRNLFVTTFLLVLNSYVAAADNVSGARGLTFDFDQKTIVAGRVSAEGESGSGLVVDLPVQRGNFFCRYVSLKIKKIEGSTAVFDGSSIAWKYSFSGDGDSCENRADSFPYVLFSPNNMPDVELVDQSVEALTSILIGRDLEDGIYKVFDNAGLLDCVSSSRAWVFSEIYESFKNQYDDDGKVLRPRNPAVVIRITADGGQENCRDVYVTAFPPLGKKDVFFYVLGGVAIPL
jgi:hypothetical protein